MATSNWELMQNAKGEKIFFIQLHKCVFVAGLKLLISQVVQKKKGSTTEIHHGGKSSKARMARHPWSRLTFSSAFDHLSYSKKIITNV
jgi:hypothetical protein